MADTGTAPAGTTPPTGPQSHASLKEGKPAADGALGLTQSTALIVGSIIGVGIFSLP